MLPKAIRKNTFACSDVKIQMRPACVGRVVVTRSPRMSHVRGSNPGTATGYALLISSNKSETRVQCFPLVWTHRNNYARTGDDRSNESGSLNRHKNTHMKRTSDNRSYSCHYCPRQFLHSSQLQDHETMEHGLPVSLKTSSPHQFDQPLNNMRDLRTRTTPQLQNTAGSSPMRLRNLSDSLNLVSEAATTSASTTPLGKLTSVANMFSKFESCPTSLLPLPAGLNLFHAVNKSSTMSNPEQHNKKTLQETELTNGAVTASAPSDGTFQCTLCPELFVSRADLETHFGQHILQQIGLPVGNLSMHYPYSNKVSQHMDHLSNTASSKTPMEEILLGVLQATGKFPFPSTTLASSVASSQNVPCTEVTSALDPFKTLSTAANSANLFPNTALVAALTSLSQLFMSAAVNGSSTPGNSGPVNNPTLLAEAISKSGILQSQKPNVPSQSLATMGSAAALLDTASFEQLLKSVAAFSATSFGSPATAYSNFRSTINQASSTRPIVKDSCSSDLEEQGMNLTATQGMRSLVDSTTPTNSTIAPPAFTSNSLMGSIPTHPFPWLINPNIVTTPSVTGPYSQSFINSTKESSGRESFQPTELNHSIDKRSPSNHGTVNLNGLPVSESQDNNATEGAALQSCIENSSIKSGLNTRQCDLCDKMFNCSSALRIHYRKHSGMNAHTNICINHQPRIGRIEWCDTEFAFDGRRSPRVFVKLTLYLDPICSKFDNLVF
ncbi:zinc finger protein [Clonorchis sinensis]|uniref:Zinc finger protein n=1 Tax=Clonorchis sinensis TaxID=79923 RepID=H2KQ75_CLOSI|nr:zinc finger protein [Clonorchis sinensis]